jgi:peptide/nickel transport system substrate-binding protein
MLNLRYFFRLISAFFSRFKVLVFISIGFGVLIFFVIRFILPFLSAPAADRIGIPGRFSPSNLPNEILQHIGNGLTKLDLNGNVEPDLASSWETPDKGKTWIFKIKDGLDWQDGKKVTAQTINYQFSDVTIERPDAKTLIFKLQNPYSAFPSVVSRPTFKSGLLGTGEWQVKKVVLAGTYIDQLVLQNKNGQKLIYKFYPTVERAVLAFELGEIDILKDVIDPKPLTTWSQVKKSRIADTGEYVAVFFNTQDQLLGDKNLRQALSYAINKSNFEEDRAIGPISVESWAYNSQVKQYNFDKEKAKDIVSDYKKSAKLDELTINLTSAPVLLPQAELIVKDWQAVGIKVNLQVMANIPSDYQALLAIFDTPEDPDQYSIWHSTQTATNITHYQNPRIDKLLEDGRSELNLEDRKKIYLDFQRYLVEDSPAAFLYYPATYRISRR